MAQDLLVELHRRGIKLRLADGRLDVLAKTGSLTPELREELRARRDELIAMLRRDGDRDELPEITPDPEHRHEPFPLTDIQHAYWVGRAPAVELGGVFTHYYAELDGGALDIDRLDASLRAVIDRHDMLRAVVRPDGQQRILPEVRPYRIAVEDLRGLPAGARDERLAAKRDELSHQDLPPERWPLFDIRASIVDDGRTRLHLNFDNLIVDAASLSVLLADWRLRFPCVRGPPGAGAPVARCSPGATAR